MTNQTVGIVGVGLMGHGIASNIQKAGWSIGFLEHPGNQQTTDLVEKGATVYQTSKELASQSDIIILCVTGSPQVESVLTDSDGVLAGMKPDTVIIDCSTAIPASTKKLAATVKQAGAHFLDAPMTRTQKEAAEGRLNLIVGGDHAVFEQQQTLFKSFAENITYAGDIGAGHAMKLLHNYVSLGYAAVLAEASAAAIKADVDPAIFQSVLAKGGGGGVVLDRLSPFILEKDANGLPFTLSNSAKDLSYYTKMCEDLSAEKSVANAIAQLLANQVEQGNGENYVPALIESLADKT